MLKLAVLALALCFASGQLIGGWIPGSVSEVSELARWSTEQMSQLEGLKGEYTIQTPKNVRKQIVNGIKYKFTLDVVYRAEGANGKYTFKSCELYIFDQPRTSTRYFVEAPVCRAQESRQVGEWTQVTAITDQIMEVARLTGKAMSTQLGFEGQHDVAKVYNVETQLVNGINYRFTVEYLVSLPDNKYALKTCKMTVNHQAWNQNKITFLGSPVCQANPSMRQMAGGWQQTNTVTDEMMSLANWATTGLSQFTGVKGEHSVMTIRKISTQVVSGVNYKFTVDLLVKEAQSGKYLFKSCDLYINYQAWTNTKSFVEPPKCGAHPHFQ